MKVRLAIPDYFYRIIRYTHIKRGKGQIDLVKLGAYVKLYMALVLN